MRSEHALTTLSENTRSRYGAGAAYALNAFVAALAWLYFVSAGFSATGLVDGVYEIQAAMLGQGRLTIEPGPLSVFFHDSLLFWGQAYFYWGLLPSVVFLAFDVVFGRLAAHYVTVFLFLFSLVYYFQRIIAEFFDAASSGDAPAGPSATVSAILLTWVILFVILYPLEHGWFFGRFAVYEQQVLFGLALGFPGLYYLIKGLRTRHLPSVAAATLFFCLAACTRVTWFPWAVMALIGTAFLRWTWGRGERPDRSTASPLLFWGIGFLLLLGLVCLNDYRFGSWTDFGVRYQNPAHYLYFRNLKMFFSPLTKAWNCAFNLMSYYAPPTMVEHLGLEARSFAFCEGFPPSFFAFNPQFLFLVILTPLGLYRMAKNHSSLAVPFFTVAACALYLQLILGIFGTFVILRYFVEFSYLIALLFLGILLMLLRPVWATLIFAAMIGLYLPGNVQNFLSITPELRTVNWETGREATATKGYTPFLEPHAVWPQGSFAAKDAPKTPSYAAMGLRQGGPSTLIATDICAVYLIPGNFRKDVQSTTLSVQGLKPLASRGTAKIFFEDRLVGSVELQPGKVAHFSVDLPFVLPRPGPYQVMIVFPEGDSAYLPGRTTGQAVISFQEIALNQKPQ